MGPTVPVMPAPGKPFEAFQADQALCTQFASEQVQGGSQQSNTEQIGIGVIGTLLGAGLGAALGGGQGAAVGAGFGALGGTAVGAGPAGQANYSLQKRYNMAYAQCMYSRGNQVPGFRNQTAPPQGYGQPQGGPPPGYAPQGYAPQGYPPQGYVPQGQPPQGQPPQGGPPPGYAPQG